MGKHKVKGIPEIPISCEYGGHEIFSGQYNDQDRRRNAIIVWTQAGDNCEGNSNGNPAANIEITSKKIMLETADGFKRVWKVPKYKEDLRKIGKEVDKELEKYYSQYIQQPMFIKKK